MKKILLGLLLVVMALPTMAQERRISGTLIDADSKEAVMQAAVQLLNTDTVFVTGTVSNESGKFSFKAPKNGKYFLKISSVGYVTSLKTIVIAEDKNLEMGSVGVQTDAVLLDEVKTTAQALKVVVVEDTFVYNSAAYRTPEGSVVEELIKRLPGAEVDDDGNIKINGKDVKKIKVDGKEFMTGDTKTAIKNLPTSIIERIKAYDDRSDQAKATGIDDGVEEMTLDFGIKRGMNKGVFGNINLGYGTEDRYAERLMGAVFRDDFRVMGFGGFNNTNDMGFGGRGGGNGRGRNGLNTSNMAGVNFNYEKKGKLKLDGSVRWNHGTSNSRTKSSSEQFVAGINNVKSFTNSINQNFSKNKSWNAQARVEWKPDTMTTINFRPSWSWSDNDGRSGSANATFDEDPYEFTTDPLANLSIMEELGYIKNSRTGSGLSYGTNKRVGASMQYTRRFGNKGRNVSLRMEGNYSTSDNQNFSTSNVNLYRNDPSYSINRYNVTPSKNWNYSLRANYSEPIAEKTYLQFSYRYNKSYNKSDRATYDFSDVADLPADYVNLLASLGLNMIPEYRNWGAYLPENYFGYVDNDLSRFSEYKTDQHNIEVQLRRVRDNYNFNVGVEFEPQRTEFEQKYQGIHTDTIRNVMNVSPTLNFRYYFNKQHQLQFRYRGNSSQPSISDMINIRDNSDPLNISLGNPGLKPSFTNNFRFNYNNYIQNHNQVIEAHVNYSTTRNSTVRRVTYNEETGGRVTRPENINGNWNISAGGTYNVSIDTAGVWNVNTSTNYSFSNHVGLTSIGNNPESQRNLTRSHNINERLAGSFRNEWLEVELDGSLNYTHSTNQLRPEANLDTWGFSWGASARLDLPWGMSFSSDIHMRSRRGYTDQSLNTDELIWNAQIAQNFLRKKNLTLSLQLFDILQNQSNFSRSISAMSRTDTEFNAINSFAMLTVNYRFNIFGGKSQHEQMGPPPPGERPRFREGDFRGGRGMGGPGGGRGPGGGFGR